MPYRPLFRNPYNKCLTPWFLSKKAQSTKPHELTRKTLVFLSCVFVDRPISSFFAASAALSNLQNLRVAGLRKGGGRLPRRQQARARLYPQNAQGQGGLRLLKRRENDERRLHPGISAAPLATPLHRRWAPAG
jgi:hypothetical protein